MSRQRDYKAEYRRRIVRAAALGLSRSQARGHARSGETRSGTKAAREADQKLERALKALRASGNQSKAAKEAGIAPERFRRFLRENKLAQRGGREWRITDHRPRDVVIFSKGSVVSITVPGFDPASRAMRYLAAVRQFLDSNDPSFLAPFKALAVVDVGGREHPFETRPNILYRLATAGSEGFEQVYRLIQ